MKITSKPKIQKPKESLRINPDINIPSTVSVGNFARLLNVNLGKTPDLMTVDIVDSIRIRQVAEGNGERWDGGTIILRSRCVISL